MPDQTAADGPRTVARLLADQRIGMLTTTDPAGTLISRPMALQEVEFDGDLWFFAARESRTVAHVRADPRVNVAVGSGSTWISLTGRAAAVEDRAKNGPDDDGVVLLKVTGESAEYWDTPGGRLASVISFAKAKMTGEPYSGGENETVRL